jgi:hypothetical protein
VKWAVLGYTVTYGALAVYLVALAGRLRKVRRRLAERQ